MGILEGKAIVVTGASSGLGEAMTVGFAAEGAKLVLAARTETELERVALRCRRAGADDVLVRPTDVTREPDVEHLVGAALEGFGRLDVFVADAGVSPLSVTGRPARDLLSYDIETVRQMFAVNAVGMWLCMKSAFAAMGDGGSFIAIGSGTPGSVRGGMLAVTKGCVDVLVAIGSAEMEAKGVRVNCLAPGGMADTHLFGPNKMPEYLRSMPGYLEPEAIVPAAVWLASEASAGISGAQLTGGNSMPRAKPPRAHD